MTAAEIGTGLRRGPPMTRAGMLAAAAVLCVGLALAGALVGPSALSLSQIAAALREAAFGLETSDPAATAIVMHIRLPRVLLGAAVGAALACSGCALQGLFRNPLADPGLIGVTAGAATGAVAAIVVGDLIFQGVPNSLRAYLLPLSAFLGAGLVTLVVFQFARAGAAAGEIGRGMSVTLLLLAGVAINAIAAAMIGGFVYVSDDQQLRDLTFWTMGGLGAADWTSTGVACLAIAAATALLLRFDRALDLLQLGERGAFHAGLDVERVKGRIGLLSALAVGAATAVAGPIGFVGLVAPHLARLIAGPSHRIAIPLSALIGAALTLLADLCVRMIAPPAEPPIGLATSLIGGPFFLWLLLRRARRGGWRV